MTVHFDSVCVLLPLITMRYFALLFSVLFFFFQMTGEQVLNQIRSLRQACRSLPCPDFSSQTQ